MIAKLLIASLLVATTVIIHAAGLGMALSHALHSSERPHTRFWPITWLLIRIAWLLIIIHMLEIAVWALLYSCEHCLQNVESDCYFRRLTYTTLRYGESQMP